jgi:hypothetical protein
MEIMVVVTFCVKYERPVGEERQEAKDFPNQRLLVNV